MDGGMAGGASWHAAQVVAGREKRVADEIDNAMRGAASFHPEEPVMRRDRRTRRPYRAARPLLVGYVFVAFGPDGQWRWINELPGVIGVLRHGDAPASVRSGDIERLRQWIVEREAACARDRLCRGQRVRIESGPFEELVGVYLERRGGEIALELDILGRSVRMQLSEALVSPA